MFILYSYCWILILWKKTRFLVAQKRTFWRSNFL